MNHDTRTHLAENTILSFPEMDCEVLSYIGCGSNAMAYIGEYKDRELPDMKHRVLIKELFPYSKNGEISRAPDGSILIDPSFTENWEFNKKSFERGSVVHLHLLRNMPSELDFNINTIAYHNTLYTLFSFNGGRTLEKELRSGYSSSIPLTQHVRRLCYALDVLAAFHQEGYLHLDISPDNMLLLGNERHERLTLIDYNSAHTLEEIRNDPFFYFSEKAGYTSPEIKLRNRSRIGYHSDLYSLTAVFYRCITGRRLCDVPFDGLHAPDFQDAECLKGQPASVLEQVEKILRRGLVTLQKRRYQNTAEMRADLEELQERIAGRGITHWALWEDSRNTLESLLRENPAWAYLTSEKQLYPIRGITAEGETLTPETLAHSLESRQGNAVFLLGGGGIGKTTALLRLALLQGNKYVESRPAFLYLSLLGWKDENGNYLKNRILEDMRFKPETDSMETARHQLLELLGTPFRTQEGEKPKLILLLDGINEVRGDLAPLLQEIRELMALAGVRLVISGRNTLPEPELPVIELVPLTDEETAEILSENGLLPPENEQMRILLRTPLILSMFIRTALDSGKQQRVDTVETLTEHFFTGIREKAAVDLPEDSPLRWQVDAAIDFVLPAVAEFTQKHGPASDMDLLPVIEKCWKRLPTRILRGIFPEWIGHTADIRAEAESPEAWYGIVVQKILWRQLGLILRDEQGRFRISHQILEEYLAKKQTDIEKVFQRDRQLKFGIGGMALLSLCVTLFFLLRPQVYEKHLADTVTGKAGSVYTGIAMMYEDSLELIEEIQNNPALSHRTKLQRLEDETEKYLGKKGARQECESRQWLLDMLALDGMETADCDIPLDDFKDSLPGKSAKHMPRSGNRLDIEAYLDYTALPSLFAEDYQLFMRGLDCYLERGAGVKTSEEGKFLEDLRAVLEADAMINAKYYLLLVQPEVDAGDEVYQEINGISKSIHVDQQAIKNQIAADSATLMDLYEIRRDRYDTLVRNPVFNVCTEGSSHENH